MFDHRAATRESKHLNKLLYDNTSGLRLIFEKSKNDSNNFTFESVLEVFGDLKHYDLNCNNDQLFECFLFSI